jgi:hypothetical protein
MFSQDMTLPMGVIRHYSVFAPASEFQWVNFTHNGIPEDLLCESHSKDGGRRRDALVNKPAPKSRCPTQREPLSIGSSGRVKSHI